MTSSFYLAANFSARNLLIGPGNPSLLLACVHFEARQLGLTPEYSAYRNRVRWRLNPSVF
jgi:hypothetical protein